MIPYAPWHKPSFRRVGPGVEVMTVYGSHVIAALLYALYRKAARVEDA